MNQLFLDWGSERYWGEELGERNLDEIKGDSRRGKAGLSTSRVSEQREPQRTAAAPVPEHRTDGEARRGGVSGTEGAKVTARPDTDS